MLSKQEYLDKFIQQINGIDNLTKLLEVKNIFLKNEIAPLYKELKSSNDKKSLGEFLNNLKNEIENIYLSHLQDLKNVNDKISPIYDLGLVNNSLVEGNRHLLNLVIEEMLHFFKQLGFNVVCGNELVEADYNFTALNIPESHPARNSSDSFFIDDNFLLRTHCTASTAQKISNSQDDDLRIVSVGNVYRKDDDDATHSHQFMQMDIVWIKENLNVSNLKWLIDQFLKYLFGNQIKTRYRLSYFPFTEPSFEVDVSCFKCNNKGCNVCKKTGWIEILGAGMLNINVLNISNTKVKNGLAAGIGIERIAMLKHSISDIRNFYINDYDFNKQFKKGN